MWDVHSEVNTAIATLQLSEDEFRELPSSDAAALIDKATSIFIRDNPRVWWLSLNRPITRRWRTSEDFLASLDKAWLWSDSHAYFVPEPDDGSSYRVFFADLPSIKRVLEECGFFEYYILSPALNYLVIETDHNELLLVENVAVLKDSNGLRGGDSQADRPDV